MTARRAGTAAGCASDRRARRQPPLAQTRFGLFTVPPSTVADTATPVETAHVDRDAMLAEFERMLPGLASYVEPDDPGMHTTATLALFIVGAHHQRVG